MLENPYIFHTYAYAIENFQCYARGLHETCVMVTLNDRRIFDFERFLESYSRTIWPLFLWHMLFYVRHRKMSMHFDMAEFDKVIMLPSVRIQDPKWAIDYLGKKVRAKLFQLERRFKKFKDELDEMALYLNSLGVNESNTYLYIQGHHLFDLVVSPIVQSVCDALRNDRENEIRDRALHSEQARTEMACYENSLGKVKMMMKKNTSTSSLPNSRRYRRMWKSIWKGKKVKRKQADDIPPGLFYLFTLLLFTLKTSRNFRVPSIFNVLVLAGTTMLSPPWSVISLPSLSVILASPFKPIRITKLSNSE